MCWHFLSKFADLQWHDLSASSFKSNAKMARLLQVAEKRFVRNFVTFQIKLFAHNPHSYLRHWELFKHEISANVHFACSISFIFSVEMITMTLNSCRSWTRDCIVLPLFFKHHFVLNMCVYSYNPNVYWYTRIMYFNNSLIPCTFFCLQSVNKNLHQVETF